jgi:hypothetical protein
MNKDEKEIVDPVKMMSTESLLADANQISERRYDSLDKRVKKLEMRGMLLPDADEEHIIFYMVVFAIAANFILPAVVRLFAQESVE